VIEKDASGGWKMTAPAPYPVDNVTVSSFVTAAANVSSDKVVEDKTADAGQYGLTQPVNTHVDSQDGKSKVLRVGDEAPAGSAVYASAAGDPHVYTIASYTKESFNKTPPT